MWRQEVFVRISTFPSNEKEGHIVKKYFLHKKKPEWPKNRKPTLDFVHSTSRNLLNGQFLVLV
jgi:hypothetical protein